MQGLRAPAGPLAPPAGRCAALGRAGAAPLPPALGRARASRRGAAGRRGRGAVAQAPPGAPNNKPASPNVVRFFSKADAAAEPAPAAPAPPHAAPAGPTHAMADVLRAIRLLEKRETELRDEMKNILGLMALSAETIQGSTATSSTSPLALAAARLERCVLRRARCPWRALTRAGRRAYSGERAAEPEAEAGTTLDQTECTVQHPGALCCTRCVPRLQQGRAGRGAGGARARGPAARAAKPNYLRADVPLCVLFGRALFASQDDHPAGRSL